jgi:hypothetical protein
MFVLLFHVFSNARGMKMFVLFVPCIHYYQSAVQFITLNNYGTLKMK